MLAGGNGGFLGRSWWAPNVSHRNTYLVWDSLGVPTSSASLTLMPSKDDCRLLKFRRVRCGNGNISFYRSERFFIQDDSV